MKYERRKIGKDSKAKKFILGALTVPILFILFTLISCIICFAGKYPTSKIDILSMVSLFAAGGIGAFLISRLDRNGSVAFPIVSSLSSVVIFILIALICNGKITLSNLMNILCYSLISIFFSFLGKYKSEKKHKRRNRI